MYKTQVTIDSSRSLSRFRINLILPPLESSESSCHAVSPQVFPEALLEEDQSSSLTTAMMTTTTNNIPLRKACTRKTLWIFAILIHVRKRTVSQNNMTLGGDGNSFSNMMMMQNIMGNMMMNTMKKKKMTMMNMQHPSSLFLNLFLKSRQEEEESQTGRRAAGVLSNSQPSFPSTYSSSNRRQEKRHEEREEPQRSLGNSVEHEFQASTSLESKSQPNFSGQPQGFLPPREGSHPPTNQAVTHEVPSDMSHHSPSLDYLKPSQVKEGQECVQRLLQAFSQSSLSSNVLCHDDDYCYDVAAAGSSLQAAPSTNNPEFVSNVMDMMTTMSNKQHPFSTSQTRSLYPRSFIPSLIPSQSTTATSENDSRRMNPCHASDVLQTLQGILSNYGKPLFSKGSPDTIDRKIKDEGSIYLNKKTDESRVEESEKSESITQQQGQEEPRHEKPVDQKQEDLKRGNRSHRMTCQAVYDGINFISGQSQVEGASEAAGTSSSSQQQIHGLSCNEFNDRKDEDPARKGQHACSHERESIKNRIQEDSSWSQLEKWVKALPHDHLNSLLLALLTLLKLLLISTSLRDQENDDHDDSHHSDQLQAGQERKVQEDSSHNLPEESSSQRSE